MANIWVNSRRAIVVLAIHDQTAVATGTVPRIFKSLRLAGVLAP